MQLLIQSAGITRLNKKSIIFATSDLSGIAGLKM
jgi:hypothetical protein